MHKLSIKTRKKREIVDITDAIEELLRRKRIAASGIWRTCKNAARYERRC
jgi:thiamine phosphate synthase YjbQ (UPF0047 family)